MTRHHVRVHARHSVGGPAAWVFIAVLSLFLTSIFVIAWMLYELMIMAIDLAGRLLQL